MDPRCVLFCLRSLDYSFLQPRYVAGALCRPMQDSEITLLQRVSVSDWRPNDTLRPQKYVRSAARAQRTDGNFPCNLCTGLAVKVQGN